jgi:hypothetical protein
MMNGRMVRVGLVLVVAAAVLTACCLPGGVGPSAQLDIEQASYTATVGASTGGINPIKITNISAVDDTAAPTFSLSPLTGTYSGAESYSVTCSAPLLAGQSCDAGVQIVGLSSPQATFRLRVSGGSGTLADTTLITFNQP